MLEWWAHSSDLIAMENLWEIVKQELEKSREFQEKLEENLSKP